jgi:hypothetical protein
LMLVYVGPRARQFTGYLLLVLDVGPQVRLFTGYCCWFMWGLWQQTLLGIVVGLCSSGNTLLGIAFSLCGTSDNTLYWALLWVM